MSVVQIKQYSTKDKIWLSDVFITVSGLNLIISGTAYIKNTAYTLNATIPFTAPTTGTDHHIITIDDTGTIVVDPAPTRTNIVGYICWFDLPAGTTDLSTIEINQLIHIEEGGTNA